jgi:hypothetical protein
VKVVSTVYSSLLKKSMSADSSSHLESSNSKEDLTSSILDKSNEEN